jgi:HSP20 family protein
MTTALSPFGYRGGLISDFRREFDDVVRRFFDDDGQSAPTLWAPQLNLSEAEDHYEVSIDLPGMKVEDINIEVRQGDLWITGQRKSELQQEGRTWHRMERYEGEFRRVVRLGDDVAPEKVSADYADGVLRINVPKSETALTRRIEVKART